MGFPSPRACSLRSPGEWGGTGKTPLPAPIAAVAAESVGIRLANGSVSLRGNPNPAGS